MKKNKSEKSKLDKNDKVHNTSQQSNKDGKDDMASKVSQFISLIDDLPYGTVLNHNSGIYFNKEVEKMIGYKNEEIDDIDEWFRVLYKEDVEKVKEIYYKNRGKNFESEVIVDIVTKSGEVKNIAFVDKLSPIGEIWGLEDKTELIEVKEEKTKQSKEYDHLLEFMKIGFWEWDIETDNLIWNDNMYNIYGFGEDKTVNSYYDYKDRLHPDDIDQMNRDLALVLDSSIEDFNNKFRIILPDGTIKHIRAFARIYRDKDDNAIKLVGLNWDVTEEVEQDRANKKLKEQYLLAIDSLEMGVWDWTLADDGPEWNKAIYKQFEVPESSKGLLDIWRSRIHPDDLERVTNNLEHVINTPGEEYNIQYRIVVPDGTIKHTKVYSKAYRNEDGVCYRMIGLNWDITEEVELEKTKKKIAQQHSLILESMEVGVWDWTLEANDPEWNDAMYKLYDIPVDSEGLLDIFQTRLHPDDVDRVNKDLERVINTPGEEFESKFRIVLTDGTIRHIKAFSKTYRDENGNAYRIAGINKDVTNEEKEKEKNEEYHHLLDFMQIGFWEWSMESGALIWDEMMYKLFGYDDGVDVSYKDYKDVLHPEDIERIEKELTNVIKTPGREFSDTFRIVTYDGNLKHIRAVAKVHRAEDGIATKMVGLNWDITDETELEERYKFILNAIEMGVWDWDINNDKMTWNDSMYDIYGYDITEKVDSIDGFNDALHPDDVERVSSEIEQVLNTPGLEFDSTFRILKNDGEVRYIRAISQAYRDEEGKAHRAVGLNWDVTKEIKLEEESKKLSEKYDLILNAMEMGVWDWDIESEVMSWNDNMFRIYGLEINEKFSNMENFQAVLHPSDKKRVNNEVDFAIDTPGVEFESTFRIIKNEKDIRYIHAVSKSYRDESGKAIRMVGLNRDITKETMYEEESKKLSEKYDLILNSIEIGIWDWDIMTDKLNWNETMYEVFGYDKNIEVNNYDGFKKHIHPDDVERVDKEIENTINSPGVEFESDFCVLLDDGTIKHLRSVSKAYRDDSGKAVRMAGVSMDVTKEKELEEESKELLEKYELILNNTNVGVWDLDLGTNKVTRSKTIFELFEVPESKDDSMEATFNRFNKRVHPDDIEQLKSDLEKILSGEIDNFESEIRIITPNGSIKYLKSVVSNEKDEEGNLLRIYGVFLDNTKIKESEKELLKAKEEAVAANKAKTEFLANMSHEIRTPMNAVLGLTHLVLKTDLNDKQKDYLSKIQISSTNLLGIINDILDFSKVEAGKITLENIEFELGEVLESVSDIVTQKIHEKDLEIIFSISRDVPRNLIGDPLRLNQIITNICSNAVKFTDEGEVFVQVEKVSNNSEQLELKFTISDTGIGMKEDQVQNLFKSFTQADNSTTRKYGGSGLGLTISKNLVELFGGRIWVESEYGKGSKFFFTIKTKENKDISHAERLKSLDLTGLRVLICDDNKSARDTLSNMLNTLLFEVTTVDNGYDAIDKIKKAKFNPYDLVLMDWKMPGLNGVETIREIYRLNLTKTPVMIMITAIDKEEILDELAELKIDSVLNKPVMPSVLFDTLIDLFQKKTENFRLNMNVSVTKKEIHNRFENKRVLLVEDNEINQLVAVDLLKSANFTVLTANDGEDAIQKVKSNTYDIVLMDLHMPGKDGYEATKEIRKHYKLNELPIVAMTADAMPKVREKCLKAGMNDYIAKPINPSKLFSVLKKWLSVSEHNQKDSDNKNDNKLNVKNKIDGIDLEFGLSVVGGNEKLYVKLLGKFDKSYQNFFEEFLSNSDKDREHTIREIHNLKGVAGNIGAKELYNLANKYNRLLEGDFIPNKDNMNDLKLELEKVLKSTAEYINSVNEGSLSAENSDSILKKKNELESLLKENDYNSIKVINELLNSSENLKYEKEFKLVQKHITEYEFEKALLELNKIKLQ